MSYCKKCGNEVPGDAVCCPKCGEKIDSESNMNINQPSVDNSDQSGYVYQNGNAYQSTVKKSNVNIMSIVWFAVGGLVLLLSIIAGFMIMGGAGDMTTLRSVGGETVAEYFYQYSGTVNKGIALAVFAFGFFGGGIFARFGFKEMKK